MYEFRKRPQHRGKRTGYSWARLTTRSLRGGQEPDNAWPPSCSGATSAAAAKRGRAGDAHRFRRVTAAPVPAMEEESSPQRRAKVLEKSQRPRRARMTCFLSSRLK